LFSYIAFSILSLLAIVLAAGFIFAVRRNLHRSNKVRVQLETRLKELRLYKVLTIFRIDTKNYLHKNSLVDIKGHMSNCDGCITKDYCDEHLCKNSPASEFHFCPNYLKLVDVRGNG
jgi:hypothetical protein